jgi:hypothetical protein
MDENPSQTKILLQEIKKEMSTADRGRILIGSQAWYELLTYTTGAVRQCKARASKHGYKVEICICSNIENAKEVVEEELEKEENQIGGLQTVVVEYEDLKVRSDVMKKITALKKAEKEESISDTIGDAIDEVLMRHGINPETCEPYNEDIP